MITVTDLPDRMSSKVDERGGHWMWTGWAVQRRCCAGLAMQNRKSVA